MPHAAKTVPLALWLAVAGLGCDETTASDGDADGDSDVATDADDADLAGDADPDAPDGEPDGDVDDGGDADAEVDGDQPPRFPLRVSADGRSLVDGRGEPFLIHGEAAWSLVVQLTLDETDLYLADREAKGINTLVVNLIEHHFCDDPPRNAAGEEPFEVPGDFSTPNEAYFEHADEVLARAGEAGMEVLLFPAYVGWGGGDEGWFREMSDASEATCRGYGEFVGDRYQDMGHIVWMAGGDYGPPAGSAGEACALAIAGALAERDADALGSAHWARRSQSLDLPAFAPFVDVNSVYTDLLTYPLCRDAYEHLGPVPAFLFEARYENDAGITPADLRRQAYWALTTCIGGHVFGNRPIWAFEPGWQEALGSTGSRELAHLRALFAPRRWHDLVPDLEGDLVAGGGGTFGAEDYVTAARTADGRLAIAYVPSTGSSPRSLTIDTTGLAGPVSVRWLNPTSGAFVTADVSPLPAGGTHAITTPGDNGAGENDWALLLETE